MTIQHTLTQDIANDFEYADAPVIMATDVNLEDCMEHYAELGCEWVEGTVYKIGLYHEEIRDYLRLLLQIFLSFKPIGRVLGEPFVMRLPAFPKRRRELDLMVILNTNPHTATTARIDSPCANIVDAAAPQPC